MAASDNRDVGKEIALPAGTVRYREAGEGKPIVFVHGYLVDGRLWDGVVDRLSDRCRCIAPDWPLGAQQVAMNPDADLSPPGIAMKYAERLAAAIPHARIAQVPDAKTFVPLDQPGRLAELIAEFAAGAPAAAS